MPLKTSLTGSYPPIKNPNQIFPDLTPDQIELDVKLGTERAIQDQIELGIDYLVDGQVRDSIVQLFTCKLPGYAPEAPARIIGRIKAAESSISAADFLLAKRLAEGRPLKAHITGPITIARGSQITTVSPYKSRSDPQLIMDLSEALGHEAKYLVEAGATIVQIDEPRIQDLADLKIVFDAMRKIVDVGKIPIPALHICGNVTEIFLEILEKAPIKIISIEGRWLNEERLASVNRSYLMARGKQIGLGAIRVDDYALDRITKVQNFIDQMVGRLGEEGIWAIMPNCGLRPMPYDVAKEKLKIMVQAAHSI